MSDLLHKDAVLDQLSERGNVAQFVSFGPGLRQRYARVYEHEPNHVFVNASKAITALLRAAPEQSVNVRSYTPEDPRSREFIYGIKSADEALSAVCRLAGEGLFTIVNETVDVRDGGVSGVLMGDLLEFAPGDTPRCVEKPGTAALPRFLGLRLLETVYHFRPALDYAPTQRIEFSLHPIRRGFRREHTILWEMEEVGENGAAADIRWPNLFSRLLGDKAFGLLVAAHLGFPVPATTVIPRGLPPFTFGTKTATGETWIRTCPVEQEPGRYTTHHGWLDPYRLLAEEDSQGAAIASVLAQEGVDAQYAGAAITTADGEALIEGAEGYGEAFMLGEANQNLPENVLGEVSRLYCQVVSQLGAARFEWVFDGRQVWIVQLHRGATLSSGRVIYPGEPPVFHRLAVSEGIHALRDLVAKVRGTGEGIILVGNVGITSHLGDILRRAAIPSRIEDER